MVHSIPKKHSPIETVEVFNDRAPPGWDSVVTRLDGNIFHSTYWADYQSFIEGGKPVFFLGRDRNGYERIGAMALFHQSSRPIVSLISRTLELPAYPFMAGDNGTLLYDLVGRCEEYARKRRCARMTIGSNMSGDSPFIPSRVGYRESKRLEFTVDLTRDMDSLWQGIRKDQRVRIKQLERKGVIVEEGAEKEELQGLKIVREKTHTRRTRKGQEYELSSDAEFYECVYRFLIAKGVARLFLARHGNEVVAAIMFTIFNGKAYSVFSGSTEYGYKTGAQSGLFWLAVETFKREGFSLLNRGGLPASAELEGDPLHGIYRFKHRLGTTPILCRSGRKRLRMIQDGILRLKEEFIFFARNA